MVILGELAEDVGGQLVTVVGHVQGDQIRRHVVESWMVDLCKAVG